MTDAGIRSRMRTMLRALKLGGFVNPKIICGPNEDRCPEGSELFCFGTPRNRRVCTLRLKSEVSKKPRKPGTCDLVILDEKTGVATRCAPAQVEAGEPKQCVPGIGRKVVARICPPQRRKDEFTPLYTREGIRDIKRKAPEK